MARAVAARMQGDDYQGRFFWLQACRLFDDRTKVTKVEIESSNVKSLDDVVVHYSGMFDFDEPVSADYYQVKFHVTANGAFTWEGMMDPRFINASSVSLLQRIHDAQQKFAPKGCGCRFTIFSPWTVHPGDAMAKIQDQTDGHLRWPVLSEGGPKSKMGKIRIAWREHLGLASDEELRVVLAPIRISHGPTLDKLGEELNLRLQVAGLKPTQEGAVLNQYDDLARKLIQKGRTIFTRKDIEDICRREGLLVGRTIAEPDAFRLGIRSFSRFAESLEDETDATLCLLRHFNGRTPNDLSLWTKAIVPEVRQFLQKNTSPSRSHHIRLQTHGTVAFLAGWELNPKSGVDIVPVQYSSTGRHVWRPEIISNEIEKQYPAWQVSSTQFGPSDVQDAILAISATHDIEKDVLSYVQRGLKTAGYLIHCRLPAFGPGAVMNGTHAQFLAQNLVASVRAIRRDQHHPGVLHIFFSAPNGLMFLFGRLAHALGHQVLYEHDFEEGGPAYYPSVSVPPANNSGSGAGS